MAPEKTDPDDSVVSEDGASTGAGGEGSGDGGDHDPYFEPVVTLPEIIVLADDEEEEEMVRLRCKLFRYHTAESPPEWKERGTGDIKILRNKTKKAQVRLLMRQDKTLKIRANHYITPYMELKPNCGSDRAFVWSVVADFADEEPKQELFAARFANAENARLFRESFDEARGIATVAEVKAREEAEKEEEEERKAAEEEEEEEEESSSSSSTTTTTASAEPSTAQPQTDGSEPLTKGMKEMTVKE